MRSGYKTRPLILLILSLISFSACAKPFAARTWITHVPPSYDGKSPVPLLLVLHGYSVHADEIEDFTGFSELADRKGFIVAYPQGTESTEGKPGWVSGGYFSPRFFKDRTVDDVAFLSWLIEKHQKEYRIDPKQIFVTGHSNGGFMAHRLAATRPDLIVAIAPYASGISVNSKPSRTPVSVLQIHGLADAVVSRNAAEHAVQVWREHNACETGPGTVFLNLPRISAMKWRGAEGTEVALMTIADQEHGWPYIEGFDTAEAIWEFFESHPRKKR